MIICGVIKQNESEVGNDMLMVSETYLIYICVNINVKTRHLSQVHD